MCIDNDLFGDVIVTRDDVETWLRSIPRYDDGMRETQIEQYIAAYDVVNKIKRAKLDNSFYCLNDKFRTDLKNLSITLANVLKPRFMPLAHITYAQKLKRATL